MNKLLTIENKLEYIETLISNSNKSNSLSNDVNTTDTLVIKNNKNNSKSKVDKELHLLDLLNIKHIQIDNYLVIDKKPGINIDLNSLSSIQSIQSLDNELNLLKQLNVSTDIIKPINFINKIKDNKPLIDFFNKNNIPTSIIDEIISISKELPEDQLCHGDLNQNNILIYNNKVTLIDYEEVCFGNVYHDYSILVANWDLDVDIIKYICEIKGLDFEILIKYSIVWAGLFGVWNDNQYQRSSENRYSMVIEYFEGRIKRLNNIL